MQPKPIQCSTGSCGISYMCQMLMTACILFAVELQGACIQRAERYVLANCICTFGLLDMWLQVHDSVCITHIGRSKPGTYVVCY